MLDARSERTLTEVTAQLRALCGQRLVAIALYGSGAGNDFVPGESNLNLIVVVDAADDALLVAIRGHVRRWHKRGVATPLLVDRAFLESALDVFPMELHDIKTRHRVLFGADLFADLPIHDQNLRYQCEHEARGKLLRLRELYLETGGKRYELQRLLFDSLSTFLTIIRTVNHMRGVAGGGSSEQELQAFSATFGYELPVTRQILSDKLAKRKWSGEVENLFHSYVRELTGIVEVIDRLPVSPAR